MRVGGEVPAALPRITVHLTGDELWDYLGHGTVSRAAGKVY